MARSPHGQRILQLTTYFVNKSLFSIVLLTPNILQLHLTVAQEPSIMLGKLLDHLKHLWWVRNTFWLILCNSALLLLVTKYAELWADLIRLVARSMFCGGLLRTESMRPPAYKKPEASCIYKARGLMHGGKARTICILQTKAYLLG